MDQYKNTGVMITCYLAALNEIVLQDRNGAIYWLQNLLTNNLQLPKKNYIFILFDGSYISNNRFVYQSNGVCVLMTENYWVIGREDVCNFQQAFLHCIFLMYLVIITIFHCESYIYIFVF